MLKPRLVAPIAVLITGLVGVLGGCAKTASTSSLNQHPAAAVTASAAPAMATPRPSPTGPPHFDTPEAAMRYLAAAWNAGDLVSLKHVTNPGARDQLNAMHAEATNLRLTSCTPRPQLGDYTCTFAHDYPPGYHPAPGSKGEAVFLVGPALTPGWYMTVFEHCG